VQAKRIHEYKRQLLNLLHVVARYQAMFSAPGARAARTVLLAGKAASAYHSAKLIIQLAHDLARWSTPTRAAPASCSWCSCPTTASAWRK
jgi:starch phosphorylase